MALEGLGLGFEILGFIDQEIWLIVKPHCNDTIITENNLVAALFHCCKDMLLSDISHLSLVLILMLSRPEVLLFGAVLTTTLQRFHIHAY